MSENRRRYDAVIDSLMTSWNAIRFYRVRSDKHVSWCLAERVARINETAKHGQNYDCFGTQEEGSAIRKYIVPKMRVIIEYFSDVL